MLMHTAIASQSSEDTDAQLIDVLLRCHFVLVILNSTFQGIVMKCLEAAGCNLIILVLFN
jgi:hypothetical protein